MTVKQEIERQEREFKELLGRVMRDPMAPILDSVSALDERIEQLETMLQDMRDVELSTLSLNADEVNKHVRSLKSLANDTPHEVGRALRPLIDQLRVQVEQGKTEVRDCVQQANERVEQAAQHLSGQLSTMEKAVSEDAMVLRSTLQAGVHQVAGTVQSTSTNVQTHLQQLATELSGRVEQQMASGEQAFARMQNAISQHVARMQENAVVERKQLEQQIASLTTSLTDMRTMVSQQSQQIDSLRQQHDALSERMAEQIQRTTKRLGVWLVASLGVVCAGCLSAVVFLAGKL
jgi:uncharacterized phage infection (PIP) family protein YhgE